MGHEERGYLTPNEVAALLMVAPVTVRSWAQRGQLPFHTTPGGHRRFLRRDVERFAAEKGLAPLATGPVDITPRVLVVDDDPQLTNYLTELLELHGAVTAAAHDGFEAGRLVPTFRPDVVLLDLLMPGIDGFAVCRQLRAEGGCDVRVVAMTGHYTPEHAERIVAAGAEACLEKPLDRSRLMRAIGLPDSVAEVP